MMMLCAYAPEFSSFIATWINDHVIDARVYFRLEIDQVDAHHAQRNVAHCDGRGIDE